MQWITFSTIPAIDQIESRSSPRVRAASFPVGRPYPEISKKKPHYEQTQWGSAKVSIDRRCRRPVSDDDYARSKRSAFITLFHAATKSFTNFPCESLSA